MKVLKIGYKTNLKQIKRLFSILKRTIFLNNKTTSIHIN